MQMSEKERRRLGVLERVETGTLALMDAGRILGISYRQMKRIRRRYRQEGDQGLVHRSRGRRSNRGHAQEIKDAVLRLYRDRYAGFGPTLFAEYLQERHGYVIGPETIRRWLLEQGLWQKVRRKAKHRQWRKRKAHFGELVQLDGSFHEWVSCPGRRWCLMVMVDDATGYTMAMFAQEETTEAAMRLLRAWVERHGVPCAFYTDRKNVYIADREPTLEEELAGEEPLSVFGKACGRLGIRMIPSYSPQAKGRVERKNGVFQDRLVKHLALNGICELEAANDELVLFLEKFNARFCVRPESPEDYHREIPAGVVLDDVLCWEEPRALNNDWTLRYANRWFQVSAQSPLPPARGKVIVRERLDGSIQIIYGGKSLQYEELTARPVKEDRGGITPRKQWKPGPDHPWRGRFPVKHPDVQQSDPLTTGAARGTVPLALTP